MRGQRDDRDVAQLGVGLELARRGPAVGAGHAHVHQDEVGRFGEREGAAFLSALGGKDVVAAAAQAARDEDAIVLGVINVEDFAHDNLLD